MSLFLVYLQCTDYFVFTPYVSSYDVACIYVYIGQKHLYAGLPNKWMNECQNFQFAQLNLWPKIVEPVVCLHEC